LWVESLNCFERLSVAKDDNNDSVARSSHGAGRVNAYIGQKMPGGIVSDSAAQFKSNVLNDAFKEINA
jgi:hypothetical protein